MSVFFPLGKLVARNCDIKDARKIDLAVQLGFAAGRCSSKLQQSQHDPSKTHYTVDTLVTNWPGTKRALNITTWYCTV